jgi:hypothetical protein
MGVDGGMNPTFLSAVKSHGGPGAPIRTAAGTIPAHVNPPAESRDTTAGTMSLASWESRPAQVQVASAAPSSGVGGFFGNLFGSKPSADARPAQQTVVSPQAKPQPAPAAAKPSQSTAAQTTADSKTAKVATAKPQPSTARQETPTEPEAKVSSAPSLLSGAAPTVPAGGFENRFGAWR